MAKAQLKGPVAEPESHLKQHKWDSGRGAGFNRQSGWLNNNPGERHCTVCGCTMYTNNVRADRKRGDGGKMYHYRDIAGRSISTVEELSCPVYIGDADSAAAAAKEHVRRVKGRVTDVESTVDGHDDRISRLEEENSMLRETLTNFAAGIEAMMQQRIDEALEAQRVLLLEEKLDDVIDAEFEDVVEKVPVHATDETK